jgi:hypothetical protein
MGGKAGRVRRALLRFLGTMCTPWGDVGDAWKSVGGLALNLATLFIPGSAAFVGAFLSPWGWVVALASLLVLAVLAGTRLQSEKDARETDAFDIDWRIESLDVTFSRQVVRGHAVPFQGMTKLWVRVTARDRGGEFSAWCVRPRGLVKDGEPVPSTTTIVRRGRRPTASGFISATRATDDCSRCGSSRTPRVCGSCSRIRTRMAKATRSARPCSSRGMTWGSTFESSTRVARLRRSGA